MKAWLVHESYKAATTPFAEVPAELSTVKGCKNSFAACQLLLHDGKRNHFVLGREFAIPDEIEIPMYRIEITSDLSAIILDSRKSILQINCWIKQPKPIQEIGWLQFF